jgi:hypothetical protein
MTVEDKIEICKEAIEIQSQEANNVEIAIKKIYYKWIASFDTELKYLSNYIEMDNLKEEYESLSEKFIHDPEFLFFIGYLLDVEPWILIDNYEEDMGAFDVLGYNYMMKAKQLDDKALIYEWGVSKDHQKKKLLAETMLLEKNKFPFNDKIIGRYFQRIFKAQAQKT